MEHRCPRCRAVRAERRTPRGYRERAALALFGYHPYRCVACERRFLDRPLARAPRKKATTVAATTPRMAPRMIKPEVLEPVARLAIAKQNGGPPRRRRARWIVDPGNGPLGRAEIYALILAAGLLVVASLAVLRLIWPESTGGVRLFD